MKMVLILATLLVSVSAFAQPQDLGYLKKEDQKFYKNDSFEGSNKMERIDSLVMEVNKVYAEMATMKGEIAELKKEVSALKAKK